MEGQLLLLQELDFLQFLLELLVLELLLLMHALGREIHIQTRVACSRGTQTGWKGEAPCGRGSGCPAYGGGVGGGGWNQEEQ